MKCTSVLILGFGIMAVCCAEPAPEIHALSSDEIAAAVRSDDMSIPSPGECFAAINKFDRPAWSRLMRSPAPTTTTNRTELALHLGTRVTDGFIAVEAQDSQGVKNVGRDIINLAKSLGITQTVIARGNSISDFAENNEWNALREELDATENEVKLAMRTQKDDDLIALVTVGAWLRGTQAACEMVSGQYRPELAQLLRQAAVVTILTDKLETLPERMRNETIVSSTRSGLEEVLAIISADSDAVLSEHAVEKLRNRTTELVEQIAPATPKAPPAS
jgi:hypothetical protein